MLRRQQELGERSPWSVLGGQHSKATSASGDSQGKSLLTLPLTIPQLSPSFPLWLGSQRAAGTLCPGTRMTHTHQQLVRWQCWGSLPKGLPGCTLCCAPPRTTTVTVLSSLSQNHNTQEKGKQQQMGSSTSSKVCQCVSNPHWDLHAPCLQPPGAHLQNTCGHPFPALSCSRIL